MICKECIHYHDDIAELPLWKRIFSLRTPFSETCDLPEFADPVDGSRYPCVTARVGRCNGKKPYFSPRDKTHNTLEKDSVKVKCACGMPWEEDMDQFGCWSCGALTPNTD